MSENNREIYSLETAHTGYYIQRRGDLAETLHYGGRVRLTPEALAERMTVPYGSDVAFPNGAEADGLYHLSLELTPTDKGDFRQAGLELRLPN